VGERISGDAPLLPHPELQLLRDFNSTWTHVLEPGDMLYLPPGYPHWGIALDPCMSYSIGFRAPSYQEILSDYCDHLLANLDPQLRYSDVGLRPALNPGLIGPDAIEQVRDIVSAMLDQEKLAQWFGCYMTRPKYDDVQDSKFADYENGLLGQPTRLRLDDASRLAYSEESGTTILYADGEAYAGTGDHWRKFVTGLCANRAVYHTENKSFTPKIRLGAGPHENDTIITTLHDLLRRGVLIAFDD
jgi:50S ribosomal protein L16 3-hydroxylase